MHKTGLKQLFRNQRAGGDFRQFIVFGKQRVWGPQDPLDQSLHLKTRKCFTQLQRHHRFNALNFYFQLLFVHVLTFWGKVLGGGGQGPPAPPYATALQAYRENKALRSDKGVSLVGLDILCFKILIRFLGVIFLS